MLSVLNSNTFAQHSETNITSLYNKINIFNPRNRVVRGL